MEAAEKVQVLVKAFKYLHRTTKENHIGTKISMSRKTNGELRSVLNVKKDDSVRSVFRVSNLDSLDTILQFKEYAGSYSDLCMYCTNYHSIMCIDDHKYYEYNLDDLNDPDFEFNLSIGNSDFVSVYIKAVQEIMKLPEVLDLKNSGVAEVVILRVDDEVLQILKEQIDELYDEFVPVDLY